MLNPDPKGLVVKCLNCSQQLRLKDAVGLVKVTCPSCRAVSIHDTNNDRRQINPVWQNLMSCPSCGKKVSSQAASCPDCGHPLWWSQLVGTKPTELFLTAGGVLATLLLVCFIILFTALDNASKRNRLSALQDEADEAAEKLDRWEKTLEKAGWNEDPDAAARRIIEAN